MWNGTVNTLEMEDTMKDCPFCGAQLEPDAAFCHHCMHSLIEKELLTPHKRRSPWMVLLAVAIAVVIVLAAVMTPPRAELPAVSNAETAPQTMRSTTTVSATDTAAKPKETTKASGSTETDVTTLVSTLATASSESGVSTTETTTDEEKPSTSSSIGTTTTTKSITTTTTTQKPGSSVATTTTTTRTATTATTTTTTKKPTTHTTATTAPVVASPLYYNISGGEVTITGAPGTVDDLVIPSKIEGYPVTAIAANAFANRYIRSISLPDSLKTIGAKAFYESWGFRTFTIPKNVTHIGLQAFYTCDDLEIVYFNALNCSSSPRAFENCTLELFAFAPGIQKIPDSLIYDSPTIRSFYIPKSVSVIPAFYSGDCSTFSVYYEGSQAEQQKLQIDSPAKFSTANSLWSYNCDYEQFVE